jgi:hypothetical protein
MRVGIIRVRCANRETLKIDYTARLLAY